MDFEKEINDIKLRLDKLEKTRLNDLANGIDDISTGTVNSGDTTTDTVINNLRTAWNQLIENIKGQ